MAESYKFSGKSSIFFDSMYSSQHEGSILEAAMARVYPCMFFFEGKCALNADTYKDAEEAKNPGADKKTKCVGAKVRCDYYTKQFQYLTKEYVKDGKGILSEHILEIFKAYLNYNCPYPFVEKFATEEGISAYMGVDRGYDGSPVVLPRRAVIEDDEIKAYPYHPTSLEYKDYISFVTNDYFKVLFPRVVFPLDIEDNIYQGDKVSVLLDVPGNGYTYVVYLSELTIDSLYLSVFDHFFETGEAAATGYEGTDNYTLSIFFDLVMKQLKEKENNSLVVGCEKIGFGVSLAELSSKYDLSNCLIIYSEFPIIFTKTMFNINSTVIGKFSIDSVKGVKLYTSYADINFASNSIYDLAVDHTLDVLYNNENDPNAEPKTKAAYKGQDLAFCASIDIISRAKPDMVYNAETGGLSEREPDPDENNISITALQLPWYHADETNKKYLWSLASEEKRYSIDIDVASTEKEFDKGKITFFKNVIIIKIDNLIFPFYIKDCKFNSYNYKVKYQAYHPMLEYYDTDSSVSFSKYVSQGFIDSEEVAVERVPNSSRNQLQTEETATITSSDIVLLESLPYGTVILIPDIKEYGEDFEDDELTLEFTLVSGDKIEYFPDTSECKDKNLFIPDKCDKLEQFKLEDLANNAAGVVPTKVELQEGEENGEGDEEKLDMSLSSLVEGENKTYYVEVKEDLNVDKGTGATYKQKDITEVSYFYNSYLGFNFLLDSVSSKTEIVEEVENDGLKIRIEKIKDSEEESDPENTEIQKLLRGERPLLEVDDLRLSQKETEGFGDAGGQEKYSFKYLYERTVRSFINNRFYEIFPIELLVGEGSGYEGYSFFNLDADSIFAMPCVGADGSYEWILPFSNSVSDFHILKKLSDAKKPKDPDVLEPPVETKHNLTHISNTYKFFGLTECGFNEEKVEFDSLLDREAEDNDKLVKEKFNTELNEVFYFYILGISKFVQDYLFLVKYKNSVIPIIKKIPVIASQVGLPDPEVSYKWKSKCSIYTYLYDTGLNPFTKVSDVDNLDFFINPFYIIVHKDFRDDKYEGTRTATNDYGFLFGTNWWVKYKQRLDKFSCKSSQSNNYNAFLDVYMTLAETDSSIPTEEDIIKGFSKAKSVLYIELGSIDYVYSSYCGDHDFTLGNTTPYLYDRAADQGLTSGFEDPRSDRVFNFVYSTGGYDKKGIGMRRSRPCSRFVGPMWFPFRACEVVRYNEFADYPGLRYLIDSESNIYHKILRGFSCTDLIFKPYPDSDFDYLFIDDCFGCINPYRYTSSFYSIDVLNYYDSSGSSTTEVAPTYLASNASVPWRSIPIFYNEKYMVFTNSHEYTINNIGDKIPTSLDGFEKYVDLNLDTYSNFKVGDTSLSVCKESEPVPGETRSILYNCLLDTPPILPYNHSRNKYICGYERMRGGDAHFIYQCIYPYHHSTPYLPGCKHIADYENKGEECYGKVENTLLPHVLPVASDASMTVLGSVFYPAIWARFFCGGYMLEHMPCPVPNSFSAVKDWLASPGYIHIYNCWNLKTTLLESENDVFWNHFDTLGCKTDGPDIMKACYNHYVGECKGHIQGKEDSDFCNKYDYNGLMFVDKNTNCTECFEVPKCESVGKIVIDSFTHSETNLTSRPLYYHFANDWAGTYDYVLLGASMKSKPTFYGDGAFRMYKDYDELKKIYTIFNKNFEVSNVAALPMFGGLGRFFRMCYFSTNYGKVPFSTLSGIATNTEDEDEDRDDNYVYKLSGYINSDTMFDNNFEYGYLPEKNLVVTVDDMYMFTSLFSFIEDDTIKLETRNCVRFEDLIEYVEVEQAEDCYYLYKGADIKIKTFGGEEDIESGPALAVMYDNNVLNKDKYNYYSEYGTKIFIADPVFGDVKIIDPFPFGDNVVISCERLKYSQGYLNGDVIKLEIKGLNIETTLEIKVKDSDSGGQAWKLYVETEKEVTNKEGDKETKSVESQIVYLCYDDGYNIGSLVVRDNDDEMLLTTHDVINVGDIKYKINRGFYLDFSNMLLPYEEYNTTCGLYNLTKAGFVPVGGGDCYCAYGYNTSGADGAPYIIIPTDACFIISLEGSFFSAKKYGELGVVGYICLETSEEYYAIGNLYVRPEFESGSEDTYKEYSYQNTTAVRYRYYFHFIPYKNYNKIKYCGAKYRFIFSDPAYFCVPSNNTSVTVKYGKFNGGELCKVTFNEVSSLKAITYSKEIEDAIGGNLSGINLYYENLNDKLMLDGNATFYTMPFGFIHKLDGGIAEDKEVEFKEGYFGEFKQSGCNYSEDEQKQKDRIELPVERDIFDLIHYSTCFVRFCLKSKFYNISTEATIDLNTSLVPDLYSSFGYVPIKQWAAPGHKLDLYPDSLYAGYMPAPSFEQQVAKAFANTSSLDSYKNDLNVLACKEEIDPPKQCSFKKLLDSIGVDSEIPSVRRNGYIIMPHNMCFITHVAHGMFGYPDITDVSDWIETPGKPAIYGIYDENKEEE